MTAFNIDRRSTADSGQGPTSLNSERYSTSDVVKNPCHLFFVFLLAALTAAPWTTLHADSDGAGCYGSGYLAYERHLTDPRGLYLIFLGGKNGISDPVRIDLPHSPGAYLFGIKCDDDRVFIALRGDERKTSDITTEIPIYRTEISWTDKTNPQIVSDKLDHVQLWVNYTKRYLKSPDGKDAQIVELPAPSINVKQLPLDGQKNIPLPAIDPEHRYALIYDTTGSTSTVQNGYGDIHTKIKVSVVQDDLNGKRNLEKHILESAQVETID